MNQIISIFKSKLIGYHIGQILHVPSVLIVGSLIGSMINIYENTVGEGFLSSFSLKYTLSYFIDLEWWNLFFVTAFTGFYLKKKFQIKKEEQSKEILNKTRDNIVDFLQNTANEMGSELKFKDQKTKADRISIYLCQSGDGTFAKCLARCSNRPSYGKSSLNKKCPVIGCMREGWDNSWYFDTDFPDYKTNRKEYIKYNKQKYNIGREYIQKMTMKSSVFVVVRCSYNNIYYGLIVLESETKNRFLENDVRPILENYAYRIAPLLVVFDIEQKIKFDLSELG